MLDRGNIMVQGKEYAPVISAPQEGDHIVCRGTDVVIKEIVSNHYLGLFERECEFYDTTGTYRTWKEWIDGGTVYRLAGRVRKITDRVPAFTVSAPYPKTFMVYGAKVSKGVIRVQSAMYDRYEKQCEGQAIWRTVHPMGASSVSGYIEYACNGKLCNVIVDIAKIKALISRK